MIQLSALSRTTSISYSFQPKTDSSISTSLVGDASSPIVTIAWNSSRLYAMPPPVPPRVKEGRTIAGKSTTSNAAHAPSKLWAMPALGVSRPILIIASRNRLRSSAILMASGLAPISSTLNSSKVPSSYSAMAVFNAVWPPMVGKMASGRSLAIILRTISGVIGST